MAKHINISLPFTPLSVDTLKRYLEGRLSAKERVAVETQLKEDPLAADALEGLRALENHDLLLTLAPALQRDTRLMLARKRHKKFIGLSIRHYVMAAAVIVVLWLSFSIFRELDVKHPAQETASTAADSQPIAQIQVPTIESPTEAQPSSTENPTLPQKPESANSAQEKGAESPTINMDLQEEKQAIEQNKTLREEGTKKEEVGKNTSKPMPPPPAAMTSPSITVSPTKGGSVESSKGGSIAPSKEVATAGKGGGVASKGGGTSGKGGGIDSKGGGTKTTTSSPAPSNAPQQNMPAAAPPKTEKAKDFPRAETKVEKEDDFSAEQAAINDIQAPDVNMSTGMDDFNAGNYAKAAEAFKKIPTSSPFHAESRLRLGQSQAALQQYSQAIVSFKNIGRKSPFHFEAQWELANTYFAKGDNEKGKKVLNGLAKENNPYQSQAQEKLSK